MKTSRIVLSLIFMLTGSCIFSQTAIVTDDVNYTTGHASSVLDVKSTTKGILIPRLTLSERGLIGSPATGLLIYQTDNTTGFYYYTGGGWTSLGGSASADGSETIITAGNSISKTGTGTTGNPYLISYSILSVTLAQRAFLSPVAGQVILCSNCGQSGELQVYNGTSWTSMVGGTSSAPIAVGDLFQGGKVAYLLQSGDVGYVAGESHGLIATTSDQSTASTWGCSGSFITGADGTDFGTGFQNTEDIVEGCTTAGTAARICNDAVSGGKSDWYLPSRAEMVKLIANKASIGGIDNAAYYWTSSEYSSTEGIRVWGTGGTYLQWSKATNYNARCIRSF